MFGKLFGRKSGVSEAGSYLKETEVVSKPTAVVLSLAAFIFVASLFFSIFLAGKWAYDKIAGRNENAVAVETSATVTPSPKATFKAATPTPTVKPTISANSAAVTPAPSTTPKASPTATPKPVLANTGPSTIPNTGPSDEEN